MPGGFCCPLFKTKNKAQLGGPHTVQTHIVERSVVLPIPVQHFRVLFSLYLCSVCKYLLQQWEVWVLLASALSIYLHNLLPVFPILSVSPCLISPHPPLPVPCVLGLQWTAASVLPFCSPLSLSAPGLGAAGHAYLPVPASCPPQASVSSGATGHKTVFCGWICTILFTLLLECVYVFCFHSAGPAYSVWGTVLGIPQKWRR